MQAEHDIESLRAVCKEFKHKCEVMRSISSAKYERLTNLYNISTWLTLASTLVFFSLSLIGPDPIITYFPGLGIDAGLFDLILKISSLFLLLSALWQVIFDKSQERFRHFSCIQRLSSLMNRINTVEKAVSVTKAAATELATQIARDYDSISADFPFSTTKDHKKAKAQIKND